MQHVYLFTSGTVSVVFLLPIIEISWKNDRGNLRGSSVTDLHMSTITR